MHPMNLFFDEINRDYWGIPSRKAWGRREREVEAARRSRDARSRD